MRSSKIILALALAVFVAVFATTAGATPLPYGSTLYLDPGSGSATNLPCATGSCFGMEQAAGFVLWTDFASGSDGGIVIGKDQQPGSVTGGTEMGQLSDAWYFLNLAGTFATAPFTANVGAVTTGASANVFDNMSCFDASSCLGVTTVGSWHVSWNGLAVAMGNALGCGSTTPANCVGVSSFTWDVEPAQTGSMFEMQYKWAVPDNDPSGFSNVPFYLIIRGMAQVVDPCADAATRCNDTNNTCTIDGCNPVTGVCVYSNVTNGTTCNDNNPCTTTDRCTNGVCGGTLKVCNDNNICTTDSCNTANGLCRYTTITGGGIVCNDNNACTLNDACVTGVCRGTAKNCSDNNVCTTDTCNTATGVCTSTPVASTCGTACTDPPNAGYALLPANTKLLITPGQGSGVNMPCSAGSCFSMEQAVGVSTWTDWGPGTDGGIVVGKDQASGGQETNAASTADGELSAAWSFFGSPGTFSSLPGGATQNIYCNHSCTGADCIFKTELKVFHVVWNGGIIPMGSAAGCTHPNCSADQREGLFTNSYSIDPVTGGTWSMLHSQVVPTTSFAGVKFQALMRGTVELGDPCANVVCTALDQCHEAGVCNTATGICSNPAKADGTACNDGNTCTTNDTCSSGSCVGGASLVCSDNNVCTTDTCVPASGCVFINNIAPCSDGNACTTNDTCSGGSCVGGPALVCNDNNICTTDTCNTAGGCVYTPNTASCSDGNACTTNDTCSGGSCVGGPALVCNDNNVCTTDTCVPATGCVYVNNTASCSDSNACTTGDVCSGGACVGTPVVCTALDQCHNAGTCTAGVCSNPIKTDGTACNDNNSCTSNDVCTNGTCAGTGVQCAPETACKYAETCSAGVCQPAVNKTNGTACSDNSACTTGDVCTNGTCSGTAVVCNDSNVCTTDTCNTATGCVYTNNTLSCTDGNACTANDTCSVGACFGTPVVCNDNNACTTDSCNTATGCVFTNNTASCTDGNACTVGDVCANGACVPGAVTSCDDGNCCTTDSCNTATGACSNTAIPGCGTAGAPLACTTLGIDMGAGSAANTPCATGSCFGMELSPGYVAWTDFGPGTDGGILTGKDQACGEVSSVWSFFNADGYFGTVPGGGTQNKFNTTSCTGLDCVNKTDLKVWTVCWNGLTVPMGSACGVSSYQIGGGIWSMNYGATVPMGDPSGFGGTRFSMVIRGSVVTDLCCSTVCNDNNICTNDSCNPATGACVYTPNTAACNDGNACTTGDVCTGGACVGTPVVCVAQDQCHLPGTCIAGVCSNPNAPNGTACSDGNACSIDDACISGACLSGAAKNCNDNNGCTDDSCDTATGTCVTTNNTASCSDGNACTSGDVCANGVCVAGAATNCDDGNCCTADSCNTATGACSNTTIPGCGTAGTPLTCTTLGLDMGAGSAANIPCASGSCFGMEVQPGYWLWTDFGAGTDGGIVTGQDQACGQVSTEWSFFGAPGYFGTAPGGGTQNKFNTASCTGLDCINKTDLKVWNVCWNGLTIPMGSACGVSDYQVDPVNGGAWSMNFCSSVPMGDPSGMGGVRFCMIARGSLTIDLCCDAATRCNDNSACTTDSCNTATGSCVHSAVVCTDGNACTIDTCNTATGCVFTPRNCSDNNACTNDSCNTATGCINAVIVCMDNNACTTDSCDTITGCRFTALPTDDGNACTIDACNTATGVITHTAKNCSDNNACTTDTCNTATGACGYTTIVCNDGSACTTDSCNTATGCVTAAVACNDNNSCTTDSCNTATGCVYAPVSTGTACTINATVGTCQPSGSTSVCTLPTSTCPTGSVKELILRGGGTWWNAFYDKQIQTKFTVMNNGCILKNSSTSSKIYVTPGTMLQFNGKVGTGPQPTYGTWKGSVLDSSYAKMITVPSTTGEVGHLILNNYNAQGGRDGDDMIVSVATK